MVYETKNPRLYRFDGFCIFWRPLRRDDANPNSVCHTREAFLIISEIKRRSKAIAISGPKSEAEDLADGDADRDQGCAGRWAGTQDEQRSPATYPNSRFEKIRAWKNEKSDARAKSAKSRHPDSHSIARKISENHQLARRRENTGRKNHAFADDSRKRHPDADRGETRANAHHKQSQPDRCHACRKKSTATPSRSSVEITLTKFEPMQGSPGDADYRNARLSYRITAGSAKINFPVITFSVESSAHKLFERRFAPPAGTAPLEAGESIDRMVSLDPASDADWSAAYDKIDKAKFSWSIDGQPSGGVEKPVHKAWP
ncbi:MAG: hypothetical protein ABJB69_06540 [Spartobacteria bacterium]